MERLTYAESERSSPVSGLYQSWTADTILQWPADIGDKFEVSVWVHVTISYPY